MAKYLILLLASLIATENASKQRFAPCKLLISLLASLAFPLACKLPQLLALAPSPRRGRCKRKFGDANASALRSMQ